MAGKVKPVPEGYHTIAPYLTVRGAAAAIDFYKKAFDAVERFRMNGPGGAITHAELQIGDSIFMLTDENLQWGNKSPQELGGSPMAIFLYVPDVDASFKQAADAGCKVTMPLADQFWGDRYGKLVDPFGHEWSMATHVEDVEPAEMERRMKEQFAAK